MLLLRGYNCNQWKQKSIFFVKTAKSRIICSRMIRYKENVRKFNFNIVDCSTVL